MYQGISPFRSWWRIALFSGSFLPDRSRLLFSSLYSFFFSTDGRGLWASTVWSGDIRTGRDTSEWASAASSKYLLLTFCSFRKFSFLLQFFHRELLLSLHLPLGYTYTTVL